MKDMKRTSVVIILCLVYLLAIPSLSNAEELAQSNFDVRNSACTIYQKDEIKDEATLLNRALAGICEIEPVSYNDTCTLTNSDNGLKVNLNVYTTNQVLKREVLATGAIVDTVAETKVVLVPDSITPEGSGSRSEEAYDSSSRCVKLYSTIYYKRASNSQQNGAYIYKVTGGSTLIDESATVTNKRYTCYSNGVGLEANTVVNNQTCSGSVSSSTFTKNTGFTKYVDTTANHYIFCEMSCRITRGGSSWNAEMANGL